MTDKENEAIESLKDMRLYRKDTYIEYQLAIETVLNLIQTQQEEIEKKDKIIDLTIAFISTRYKEDEDINNFAKEVMERGEWTNLKKILKEYFINKVEKEN